MKRQTEVSTLTFKFISRLINMTLKIGGGFPAAEAPSFFVTVINWRNENEYRRTI